MRSLYSALTAIFLLLMVEESQAQDLDPRAYARIPVNVTVLIAGFGYSHGGIVTDATLPVEDLTAKIGSPSIGVCSFVQPVWPDSTGICCLTICLGGCFSYCRRYSSEHNTLRNQRYAFQIFLSAAWCPGYCTKRSRKGSKKDNIGYKPEYRGTNRSVYAGKTYQSGYLPMGIQT